MLTTLLILSGFLFYTQIGRGIAKLSLKTWKKQRKNRSASLFALLLFPYEVLDRPSIAFSQNPTFSALNSLENQKSQELLSAFIWPLYFAWNALGYVLMVPFYIGNGCSYLIDETRLVSILNAFFRLLVFGPGVVARGLVSVLVRLTEQTNIPAEFETSPLALTASAEHPTTAADITDEMLRLAAEKERIEGKQRELQKQLDEKTGGVVTPFRH